MLNSRGPVIAVTEPMRAAFIEALREVAPVTYEPDFFRKDPSAQRLANSVRVLVTRSKTRVDGDLLQRTPGLRCIAVYGAGCDHLDLGAIKQSGLTHIRCSEPTARSIAEYTLGLALSVTRSIARARADVLAGKWEVEPYIGMELHEKVVLVIGCGPMGIETALLFRKMGSRVLVAMRRLRGLPFALSEAGCEPTEIEAALPIADLVTLHVPGGRATHKLVDAHFLAQMKRGSYLINTSRGSVIDLPSAIAALARGQLKGLGLDVLPEEPPSFPIPDLPGLVVTPHIAIYSREAIERRISHITSSIKQHIEASAYDA